MYSRAFRNARLRKRLFFHRNGLERKHHMAHTLKPLRRNNRALPRKDHFNVFLKRSHFGNEEDESSPRRGHFAVDSLCSLHAFVACTCCMYSLLVLVAYACCMCSYTKTWLLAFHVTSCFSRGVLSKSLSH